MPQEPALEFGVLGGSRAPDKKPMGLRIDATSSAADAGSSDYPVPEPALEFAVLSTKAASEKKPVTLQCSIRCFC